MISYVNSVLGMRVHGCLRVWEQSWTDCGGEIKQFINSIVSMSYRTRFVVTVNNRLDSHA